MACLLSPRYPAETILKYDTRVILEWRRFTIISRRDAIRALGALPFIPKLRSRPGVLDLRYRLLGRTGRWVVPYALGGQASLQWTGAGVDAPDIIVRAIELGINYLDTANAYGTSQGHYGEAFRRLRLRPDDVEYNQALRERLFLATKTGQRLAPNAISDLRRSLTVMFGDGSGYIPEGAYLDCMQIHNMTSMNDVTQIYEALDARGGTMPTRIGALAALLDYRDGTNYTGLNPERRAWIRHIGITGHQQSDVLMATIRRDTADIIDTLLVTVNPNDRKFACHQNNVIPLARARGLGVIAMKVMSEGTFFGGPNRFPSNASEVIKTVGMPGGVSVEDIVRYPLSIPGVTTEIVGIGRINREVPESDQLVVNLAGVLGNPVASAAEMQRIEDDVAAKFGMNTNFFNERRTAVTQPTLVSAEQDADRLIVRWNTALAAANPLRSYNIYAGKKLLRSMPFRPQLTETPYTAWIPASEVDSADIRLVASEEPPARTA